MAAKVKIRRFPTAFKLKAIKRAEGREAIATNKTEIDERISRVFEDFQKLDSMRKNIGEMFTSIRGTLNRIG